jgi:uncharacterized protein YozE (UPF0346 family)
MKTFKEFLQQHERKNTAFGELAHDILTDPCLEDMEDYETITGHMAIHGACTDARKTFKRAWNKYQKSL